VGKDFLAAAGAGDVAAVEAAVADDSSVVSFSGGFYDWTALHTAAGDGHKEVAQVLLRAHAAVDAKSKEGRTPLHVAAVDGHKEIAEVLLRAHAAVDAKTDDGWTPLHMAACGGHEEVAEVLLRAHAAVDAKHNGRATPLHMAAGGGHKEFAEVLLRAHAAVDAKTNERWTPLHVAACGGHKEVAEVLLRAHAAVDAKSIFGWTPLHVAARDGHKEVAEVLLRAHAAVDAKHHGRATPLHVAAGGGHKEVAEVLLRAHAAVDAKSNDGRTPLHTAAGDGHKEVAEVLLRAHAAVDAKSNDRWTPLHVAAGGGHKEVAEVLLRAHAAVDAKSNDGRTPLHTAASDGHKEVAEVLLRAHAAVDAKTNDGRTPLHVAAVDGHKEVAVVLLCAGAAVDAPDGSMLTPLRVATLSKKLNVVRLLLEWHAVPHGIRPKRGLAGQFTTSKQLRDVFDEAVRMTEQELESAKAAWRAAADAASTDVAVADPIAQALVALQAAYDGFEAAPDTLSVGALEAALTPPDDLDVRWHVLAHRVLLFAVRVGLFGAETTRETLKRRNFWFRRIYRKMMSVLTPCDHVIVSTLVCEAEENGLLEPYHISDVDMGLELHATFYAEVVNIHRCLADLKDEANCAGQHLRAAIEQLNNLGQYIVCQEAHARKVALAKSAVKIGVSLAPVVGSVLGVTVDVVAELVDGLPGGAAAVVRCLADPTNVAAARQVLVMVGKVEDRFSPALKEQLSAAVAPFESVAALEGELGSVATLLGCAWAEQEGVVDAVGDTAGDDEAGEAVSEAGSDPLDDFQGVTRDAAIEHGVDGADELRDRATSRPAVPPAAHPPPSASGGGRTSPPPPSASPSVATSASATVSHPPPSAGAGSGAATPAVPPALPAAPAAGAGAAPLSPPAAPRPSDAVFFVGARDWTVTETADRLVQRVARVYDAPRRAELVAIVRTTAAEHCVTGESLEECTDPHAMAVGLLGDWGGRLGVVASVTSFIEKVQRFTAQQ